MRFVAILALATLIVGCAGGAPTAPQTAPAPPPQSQAQPAPAAPSQPAAAPKPAAQPAKPAAAPAKPSTQAAKPAASGPTRLTMGSPPSTSGVYPYTVALAKLLQSKIPNLNVTVSEGAGAPLNGKRLREGSFDFAITTFAALYAVYAGLDPGFKDEPLKDARILWGFTPLAQVWFVREDSGVRSVEQLQGKDFNAGGKGTGTELLARTFAFPPLGVEPRWYVGGMTDAQAAMKDRRIVGMGKASAVTAPDALIQDVMVATRIRILSWTPEQVQKVRAKYPFMSTVDIPAGTYKAPWNEQPLATWAEGTGMFTLARLSEDLAYAFTKAAVEDTKAGGEGIQATAYPAVKESDMTQLTTTLATVPLHAGSYRYFKEIGAKVPDHLKPPEAK